jgi:hypothetical protein
MRIEMFDTLTLDAVRPTRDGYLAAFAKVARTGIQVYKGRELGKDRPAHIKDDTDVRVYRPPEEVFNADALASMAHRPITLGHPKVAVTAKNWKQFSRGHTGDDVVRDGEFVRISMLMMDQGVVDAYQNKGIKELSWGYGTELKWGEGTTEDGLTYDAKQTEIRANHLAVVPVARGGSDLRLGDTNNGDKRMTVKTITVDGVPVELDDVQAAVVQRHLARQDDAIKLLDGQVAKLTTDAAAAATTAKETIEKLTKDGQTKDGEIAVLKKQVEDGKVTPEKLDVLVKDRQTVIDKARTLLGDKYVFDGKTVEAIRKDAVTAKLGDGAKDLTSDGAIEGAFSALTVNVKDSGVKQVSRAFAGRQVGDAGTSGTDIRDAAWAEREKHLQDAWKTKPANA